ncbi:hypothetical protein D9613_012010 [Agrocybe pediades]|uniref:Uncharacterized protein n=1 Tax=Agrocybe pediades TaxID=84607 RepID=A0A8H4QFH3_9AGAR|nr:hypothetical protein D9613_012010 [Agrocybe pediades]
MCPSAFADPDYDPYDFSSRAASFLVHNSPELRWCTIPPELQQAVFSFPLRPHISFSRVSSRALDLAGTFLHVLRIMVSKLPDVILIDLPNTLITGAQGPKLFVFRGSSAEKF